MAGTERTHDGRVIACTHRDLLITVPLRVTNFIGGAQAIMTFGRFGARRNDAALLEEQPLTARTVRAGAARSTESTCLCLLAR